MMKLRELREQRRINQEGLAQKINVSQSTISAYEIGERTPDLETLIKLATFFNVSIDYLVGISETKRNVIQSDLTSDEIDYLHLYRCMSDVQREKIRAYIDGLVDR